MASKWPDMFFGSAVVTTRSRAIAPLIKKASAPEPGISPGPAIHRAAPSLNEAPVRLTSPIPPMASAIPGPGPEASTSAPIPTQWPYLFFGTPSGPRPVIPAKPVREAKPAITKSPSPQATSTQWPYMFFGGGQDQPISPATAATPAPADAPVPYSAAKRPNPIEPKSWPSVSPGTSSNPSATQRLRVPLNLPTPSFELPAKMPAATPTPPPVQPTPAPAAAAPFVPASVPVPPPDVPIPVAARTVVPPVFSQPVEPFVAQLPPGVGASSAPAPEPLPVSVEGHKEFLLNNGERVSGVIISETPDSIYLRNDSLGTVTVPRSRIASRLMEVVLLNGDRVVGEVITETPEYLYLRNATLGTVTVPRGHLANRVVEMLLHNGNRVVGEIITETSEFTVLKSAALGTLTVLRAGVQQVNRRAEVREGVRQIDRPETAPVAPPTLS